MDTVCMVLSFDILRNKVHGAWAVQRNSCNNVLQILGFQLLHEAGHPCTFQLEHSICLSSSQHLIYILIIIINQRCAGVQRPLGIPRLIQRHRFIITDVQFLCSDASHRLVKRFLETVHGALIISRFHPGDPKFFILLRFLRCFPGTSG